MLKLIERLGWDSNFFQIQIGKLTENRLTPKRHYEAMSLVGGGELDCLYAFLDPMDEITAELVARSHGFLLADTRVVYTMSKNTWLESPSPPIPRYIELTDPKRKDIEELRQAAADLHTVSRFHFDAHFRNRAQTLYNIWLNQYLNGETGKLIVIRDAERIVAFVGCTVEDGIGELVLVSVHPEARGRGFGKKVVIAACDHLTKHGNGVEELKVKTQLRNVPANRCYEGAGFRVRSVEHAYHIWRE